MYRNQVGDDPTNLNGGTRTLRCLSVPSQKKDRQWVSTRARAAAIEAARRRQMRRRLIGAVGAGVLVIALVAGVALSGGGSGKTASKASTTLPTTPTSPTSTTAPLPSAAGMPCVTVSDPLPEGAPDVPVEVGPPPAQLVTKDLKDGAGSVVTDTETLSVNYIGVSCSTGKIFDSSYKRGQPASFSLQEVIKGWQQGIAGMKVGGQRLLAIPPDLAYGSTPPAGSGIAPDETLWFVVDVLSAQ